MLSVKFNACLRNSWGKPGILGFLLFLGAAQSCFAAAPANDACDQAIAISVGTTSGSLLDATPDGSASVGPSGQPDVWYVFQAAGSGMLAVTTCGTHDLPGQDEGVDTVLSLHSECPGSADNEQAANDNWTSHGDWAPCLDADTSQAGDAAVQLLMEAGQTVWIRVSCVNGPGAGDFRLHVYMPDTPVVLAITACEPVLGSYLGGMPFEMHGTGFTESTQVFLGDNSLLDRVVVSDTLITGAVPPLGFIDDNTPVPIRCVDPELGEAVFDDPFTYLGPLRIDSVEPDYFEAGTGGIITVHGNGFRPETQIRIGDTELVEIFFVNAFLMEGIAPPLEGGTYDVTVEDWLVDDGMPLPVDHTLPDGITYGHPEPPMPEILSVGDFVLSAAAYTDYEWSPLEGVFTSVDGVAVTSFQCGAGLLTDVRVGFTQLTVRPDAQPNTGTVLAGSAVYPTTPASPLVLGSSIAGFFVHIEQLTLQPDTAIARIKVQLPASIVDPATCTAAVLDVGEVSVTPTSVCEITFNAPLAAFGPWRVGDSGMTITGTGFVIDLSITWGTGRFAPSWQGVILQQGQTVASPTGTVISNTGYLKGPYTFSEAIINAQGLEDIFTLSSAFDFKTLSPFGYTVTLNQGSLQVSQSRVIGGSFTSGEVEAPEAAVLSAISLSNWPVVGTFTSLSVQSDLDLYAEVTVPDDLIWGDLSNPSALETAYAAKRAGGSGAFTGYVYFSAAHTGPFWPVTAAGAFKPISGTTNTAGLLEQEALQGLTVFFEHAAKQMNLYAYTPDLPATANPIAGVIDSQSWLNVGAQGVHGNILVENLVPSVTPTPTLLGPTGGAYYKADKQNQKKPFKTTLTQNTDGQPSYLLKFQFSDSAVFSSDAKGSVKLEGATKADMNIKDIQFTSTAHLAGAKVVLPNDLDIDYWGLKLTQKSGATAAGVVSLKSGQIFLTQAGLKEPVHWTEPFWLLWGEIFASGNWGELEFDHSTTGQEFDGITYVTEAVELSAYDPTDTSKTKSYLQVGGNINFDFFGLTYLNILDRYDSRQAQPYKNRLIELRMQAGPGADFKATDDQIEGVWADKFGQMDFQIFYDDIDQDGFTGDGTSGLLFAKDDMDSFLNITRKRICITVDHKDRNDFEAGGGMIHLGAMTKTTGCGCIEKGQLKRLVLSAELDTAANAGNPLLRQANYASLEVTMTPVTSTFETRGNFYINVLSNADMEVTGQARFETKPRDVYVDALLYGKVDASALLGSSSMEGSGKLNWHVEPSKQWMQGRLGVKMISGMGGMKCEGGFFAGYNADTAKIWVLGDEDGRFALNTGMVGNSLTGVYAYGKYGASLSLIDIISGGYEGFVGLGAFSGSFFEGSIEQEGFPLPYVVGHCGLHVWGKVLHGIASASAWGHLQLALPCFFSGTIGLKACGLWVLCVSLELSAGLDKGGFYFKY